MKNTFVNEYTFKKFLDAGKEAEFDSLFDSAVKNLQDRFNSKYPMYINGKQVFSDQELVETSPIDRNIVIGIFPKATRQNAKDAIAAAKNAFKSWSLINYKKRAEIFEKAAQIFHEKKFELAAILSYENAKSRYESIGEIDEAIDFIKYYVNELRINKGFIRKTSSKTAKIEVEKGFQGAPEEAENVNISMKPYGVFGVIAPFNFPVSISVGMSVGALITGNTVIFKPSTDNMTILTALKIYEIFKESGVPDGVFNVVSGPGSEVGDELAMNPDVAGIAFTGSRAVGLNMIKRAYEQGMQKVFVVEMGGKNPAIVSKYCDIDIAVNGVANAAFGFAGQKCSALSRLYVHESIKELFVSKLIDKLRTMKIGNPIKKDVFLGPLISEAAYRKFNDVVTSAKQTGRILYGGNLINTGLNGRYVEPMLIEVSHSNDLVTNELFLPVLSIETFKDFETAIDLANDTKYGLTAGLYSKNKKEIAQFSSQIQAGVVYINRRISATTGAIVGLHTFVGWKGSGLTGKGTGSKHYLQQFMKEQSISITKQQR